MTDIQFPKRTISIKDCGARKHKGISDPKTGQTLSCTVCYLRKIGKAPKAYRIFLEGVSGRVEGKTCSKCGKTKPLTEFYEGSHSRRCRSCHAKAQRLSAQKKKGPPKPRAKPVEPDMSWLQGFDGASDD